jgi:hypothetical protein
MVSSKERSPNYPSLSLDAAVQAVRQVYEKERRSVVPVLSVAKALGHDSLSGPALSKVAALRQYGLLEDVGHGKVKVSDNAMPLLLRKPGDPEYEQALREAALRPPLFRELFESYADSSDDTLRYHLITDRRFSEEGTRRVMRAFRHTVAIAKLGDESYNNPSIGSESAAVDDDKRESRFETTPTARKSQAPLEAGKVAYSWPLGDGNTVQLTFNTEPTQKNIEILLAQLKIVREIAPAQAPPKSEPEREHGQDQ